MKIIDITNPQRVNRKPDDKIILLDSGSFMEQGFIIKKIELRLYVEKIDQTLGPYSLITTLVETDKGDVEMIYDEGFRGENMLKRTSDFILNNTGLAGIILRSTITLNSKKQQNN